MSQTAKSPLKNIVAVAAAVAVGSALLNTTQNVVSLPTVSVEAVTIALPAHNASAYGFRVYLGHSPHNYDQHHDIQFANIETNDTLDSMVTISNLDSTKLWFIAVALTEQVGNAELVGHADNEVMLVPTNCAPALYITNGAAVIVGWADSQTTNQIAAGPVDAMTNLVAIAGNNGPWMYQEPVDGPSRFYKITTIK